MTDVGHEVLRRHFVAITTASYQDPVWPALPGVRDEVATLKGWLGSSDLGERRFDEVWPELAEDPPEALVRRRLTSLARERKWTDADAAVVFVSGHGVEANDTHYLIFTDSDYDMVSSTALRTADLIAWLNDTPVQHLLLIVDACFAGGVAEEALRLSKRPGRQWLVLPSATREEEAVEGALTTAISRFLKDLCTPEGRRYGEGPYIDVADFLQDVQKMLGEGQTLRPLYGSRLFGPHVCLPNPHHRPRSALELEAARQELALPHDELTTHWAPRSRGVARIEEPGWLFSGRRALMRRLIASATGAPCAVIVSGGAGSGKSAALARLVTLSDQRFLEKYAHEVEQVPADLRPPPGAVDVAVLATGKLHSRVMSQICSALQVPVPTGAGEPTVDDQLAAWHAWLKESDKPVTIVVDALDEAADPQALVRELLAYLEPDPATPRLRLLVGVRSLAATDDTRARGTVQPETLVLADLAERLLGATRIAVDEAPWWDRRDVVAYVQSILTLTPGSPYGGTGADAAATVAQAVGRRAGRSFLVARIATRSLADRDKVVLAEDSSWLGALDDGLLGVFRTDLRNSVKDPAERRRAVVLMRAVAFAFGSGIPWRGIWPLMAHAVDDDGDYYGDSDIAWLLGTRLSAYLVTDRSEGTTVYRLFHDLLRSTLKERWQELLTDRPTA
ncbi:caspase family protein [Streptomyces longwoodensis]|uniref:caspase family protein n=1 Tax=Streptomyces longwoodensis TaxID=68231 RepID=UPI0032541B47